MARPLTVPRDPKLMTMGFDHKLAERALRRAGEDFNLAVDMLTSGSA